ncbi:LHFPL tetraspan subfamily member 2a protein-like [Teleopsis dalmanni]|uniref:LHFPL tetraspan subfamily member 2a protein-like n=1 Tax=Teleopsis dalmanni TaxID=139649 RepID=UPI000D32D063|nr:LHFPL tetraspan subfamily member 2a protein-like [Teleopsis dalmanni]XP_037955531.1 LHFPL tetraspan subfamily member 2a protein-like [Teleopsis dalmanni]
MCYVIITGCSLIWFILSLITDMFIVSAIVTPKWLIGPEIIYGGHKLPNQTFVISTMQAKFQSVGIYTRCKSMHDYGYHCGPFDLDGFATDGNVYPTEWKIAMFFISFGFAVFSLTVFLTLLTCCRQSAFGKSIHNMTACLQVISGISVMLTLFLHPLGWGARRVQMLCGVDAEPFYPANCTIGISFYCAVSGVILAFICAGISLKAENSNMRSRVKRRVEGGERLVCIP